MIVDKLFFSRFLKKVLSFIFVKLDTENKSTFIAMRLIIFLTLLAQSSILIAQTTLHTETFEGATFPWTSVASGTSNFWINNTCAGNGPSITGTKSLYVTKGGTIAGCGASGTEQYAYDNAATGLEEIIAHTTINGTCASNLNVTFDYKIEGVALEDYAQLVYSTDGGASWLTAGAVMVSTSNWTANSIALPLALDYSNFELGFRFTYTDATIGGTPLAIDNLVVTGFDASPPVASCPGTQYVNVDNSCSGTLADYTGLVSASDNCTPSGMLSITQAPPSGTIITANTSMTITVLDEQGNSTQCTFTAEAVDNIDPVITCPSTFDVAINSSCDYPVPDLSGQITASDNCTASGSLMYAQNPAIGAIENSLTAVLITVTDAQGNSGTCITMLTPIDNDNPTITCPSPAPINNGTNCTLALGNYISQTLVLDNCSNFAITQNPPIGTTMITGNHTIEMEVMDVGGNMATCSFNLYIFETEAPTIVCPTNIVTCDPVVNYAAPTINDNCITVLTQTDGTGFTSGDLFPIGVTPQTYMVADSSGNSQSCSFTVEILEYPSDAIILLDTISLCQSTSTTVEAIPATSGTGEWSVFSGQAAFNNQFANLTGVNNLAYQTNILVWTISTPSCGSKSDTIRVIASQMPLPASTLDTMIICSAATVNLSANPPLYGIGTWTSNTGASIQDVNLPTSTASNMANGWNDFVWTITNGSCPSTSDTMHVYHTTKATIAQNDTIVCIEQGAIQFNATTPAQGQTAKWQFISGSGSLTPNNTSNTTANDFGLGVNLLMYKLSHPVCGNTQDTVKIVASLCDGFDPVFPTVITPNFDGKNDVFMIDFLEKAHPNCHIVIFNRWGSVVFESVGYQNPWDGTHDGEPLPLGTYYFKLELNDDQSTVYQGPISIIR